MNSELEMVRTQGNWLVCVHANSATRGGREGEERLRAAFSSSNNMDTG